MSESPAMSRRCLRRTAPLLPIGRMVLAIMLFCSSSLAAQSLTPIGDELKPPQVDEAVVSRPSVAMTSMGDSLIVWEEFRRIDGVDSSEIHGRAYDRDGVPYGDSFRIDPPSDGIPGDPQVVARPDGSYLVSWMTSGFLGFADIVARPVSTDGELDGSEIVLVRETYFEGSRETHGSAISPRTGNHVTAWSSANPSGEGFMVYRRFTAAGVPGSFGELGTGVGRNPVVDIADDGALVAVWREGPASPRRLLARRISASDEPLSEVVTLASDDSARRADVVVLADGAAVIAWVDADGAPVVRRFEEPGLTASGPAVRLAEANDAADLQLVSVGRQLFASWSRPDGPDGNSRDVVGRFLSADLALLGDEVRLNPDSERDQDAGSIATNGSDRMIAAWWHQLPDVFTGKRTIRAQVFEIESACGAGPTRLCLNGDRFAVEASWRSSDGSSGRADARQLTDDSGYFAFFDPDNVELLVKVLDACQPPFERYWVFAAGLTDVEVDLTVTDTATGEVRRYSNPLGAAFEPILDTDALDTCP